mmetsp:Transcript_189/g.313  ORF Transcript_189/g.313 Transcript_189/m.313 type:complete len:90 (+) Transcript_189:127-396(+)
MRLGASRHRKSPNKYEKQALVSVLRIFDKVGPHRPDVHQPVANLTDWVHTLADDNPIIRRLILVDNVSKDVPHDSDNLSLPHGVADTHF